MEYSATVTSSIINLTKTIIGAGLLAVPFAYSKDGILFGIVLTVLAASTTAYGLYVLGKSSKLLENPRTASFFTLCTITYPKLSLVFDFAMFVQCFGVALSYLVLVGDVFSTVFGHERQFWIYWSTAIIVPLSLLKNLDSLKYSSMVGLFAIGYIVLFIIATFFIDLPTLDFADLHISLWKINSFSGLLSTFSILIFAFTASMNIFSICNEINDNSMKNITTVINSSVFGSCLLFIIVGVLGYMNFGNKVLGNVILNYNPDSIFTKVGQFSLGCVIVLSFPLLFHPLRIASNNMVFMIEKLFFTRTQSEDQQPLMGITTTRSHTSTRSQITSSSILDSTSLQQHADASHVPFSDYRFYSITAILLTVIYYLGLRVKEFALVLSLVGATGSTAISFILPGLLGYKLFKDLPNSRSLVLSSIALIIFGFVTMVVSVFATLYYS